MDDRDGSWFASPQPLRIWHPNGKGVAPAVTTQPSDITVTAPAAVNLTAVATGAVSWKWTKDGADVAGATGTGNTATYTKDPSAAADSGSYVAVFTNANGNTSSTAATVTVNTTRAVRSSKKGAEA